jgi:hypothetical protein
MGGVTFRQTFLPLQFVSRVLCTTPFTLKNGHLAYSKPSVALSLLYFTIFVTTAVLFFMENPMLMPADLFQIKTVSFVVWFRTIANISVLTILIVGISITSKTFMKQIIKLSALETEFFKLDQDDHISQCNRKNRNASVVLCVISHLVFSVAGGFLAAFTRKSWQSSSLMEQICCCVIMMYPRLVVGNVNLTIYLIQMLLQTRFAVINNYLRRKIGESKRVKKYPVGTHFCEEVRHLGGLHKSLVQIAKEFNGIFSFHLLVWITISFILLVGDLYVAIYFFSHLSWNNIVFALNLVKNILMYSFDLLMLSRYSSQLCHEVSIHFFYSFGKRKNFRLT